MVTFLPFKGLRPALRDDETIADRVSPPYDVIGPEALAELQSHGCNVTRFTLMPDNGRYANARKEFDAALADGLLAEDEPSFYLYRQTFDDSGVTRVRTGIAGILRTEDYSEGGVIPHEETFSKVKADRLNLLRDMEVHLESIFGIFPGLGAELMAAVNDAAEPLYQITDGDGVRHEYLKVSDPSITSKITDTLKSQSMLIADGHHRYETALAYAKENPGVECKQFVLATLVAADDEGLVIWPTHRLVDAGDIGENGAVKKIQKTALETEETTPEEMLAKLPDYDMGLYFKTGRCMLARHPRSESEDPLWGLDTYIAQQLVLNGVYKADEGKSKVSYDADTDSVMKSMAAKQHDLAIILNHPSLQSIWDLSLSGRRMPKKTTYFFPKIWSGFVFYPMRK